MKRIPLSLVMTVYNEEASIDALLESIRAQSVWPDEVVIVDACSQDRTGDRVEAFARAHAQLNIRLLRSEQRVNIARGRNRAIESATHPLVAITDAGCVLDGRWLEKISEPLLGDGAVDVVSGWYEPLVETAFHRRVAGTLSGLEDVDPERFLPSGRSVALRKSCWALVGGYPEELTLWAEDTVFGLRLRARGCRFIFVPEARVYWRLRDSVGELLRQHHHYGFGEGEARIYGGRYLLRLGMLLCPPLMLLTRKRLRGFGLRYLVYGALVTGWVRGLWRGRARAGLQAQGPHMRQPGW